jgi:UDP-N-acetylglucosamine 2-epimerase (non-hydrolysing)
MNPVMVVVGTRPEIVKMAPVIKALKAKHTPFIFVHCGQHYDYNMSQQFIEELGLPEPDYGYKVRASSQGLQTARIMVHMEKLLKKVKSKIVLIEGDTNGVLATALAAVKLDTPVGHVEAGLRSFDLRMPEEHNRRLTDHISTLLFAPTKNAKGNLEKENVWGEIYITGNTVIDAVIQHLPIAQNQSNVMENLRFKEFALVTAHRAENVDNPHVLKNFIEAFMEAPIPIVYPVHPRTRKRLRQSRMWKSLCSSENVQLLSPVGYFDFLMLMKNCKLILTDSGGIQEEATAPPIRKPVLAIRLSTERPEAVEAGFVEVVGTEKHSILESINCLLNKKKELPTQSPYGDGKTGKKIAEIVEEKMNT